VVAGTGPGLQSFGGRLRDLAPLPAPDAAGPVDAGVALHAALAVAVQSLFNNTGPTGQRAMQAMTDKGALRQATGVEAAVVARSAAYGQAVAAHILDWSQSDGGAVVENMGFPLTYALGNTPASWVPTSRVSQQQTPLLPLWGQNRTFAMPSGDACGLPPPPDYSEDAGSAFFAEAKEVYDTVKGLTDDQKRIARFWSDDPMLTPTPPGHWMHIALRTLDREGADLVQHVDVLARMGIVLADAFIACWASKFAYDLLRPVTYIRRFIDPKFEPPLNTPPFPEYPSGHSTQSAAAAVVLAAIWGDAYAFEDDTHVDEGLPGRSFPSFQAAAEEAALSRLYGGIHFRSAIERGLEQGRCVGAFAAGLQTRI
jgi:PAP2 superfamily